ncbi:MAG TPA: bifunctional phosphoribosyl-AMP cyclohydrolase/phosphoribosyl-ATP diphosphatase HisIE [Deltaproteobacteria bacterium]|nr:bifunctional phosphoribosyl-AMP cyclohydrolase/phosphoribosyl-ATP diphosphatase HisIE [Deltaproteobacteria bacterium]
MVDTGNIKFNEQGLVPAITQDWLTGEVLMLAYMNREALEKTIETGRVHYYSRSRKTLWLKGESSGNFQELVSIHYDCDGDSLLVRVKQTGNACHTGKRSCFFTPLVEREPLTGVEIIARLFNTIKERKGASAEKSYTASLYEKGLPKIAEKIYEEASELIVAAKKEGREQVVHEMCDLWYHTLVLLGYKDVELEEVLGELARRFGTSGIEEKKNRNR